MLGRVDFAAGERRTGEVGVVLVDRESEPTAEPASHAPRMDAGGVFVFGEDGKKVVVKQQAYGGKLTSWCSCSLLHRSRLINSSIFWFSLTNSS